MATTLARPAAVSGARSLRPDLAARALGGLRVARSLAAATLLWWIAFRLVDRPLSLPDPLVVAAAWWETLIAGELLGQTATSLRRLAVAYAAAATIGTALGFALGRWRLMDRAFGPLINAIRAISGIAWIPIAVVWFGVGEELPVFIIFYGAVFPFVLNAQLALTSIDQRLVTAAQTLGAGPRRIVLTIMLPAAVPYLLTGARVGLGLAWMSIIAAELLGAPSGLGFSIQYARMIQQTPKMLAWILWIGVLGYALDAAMRAFFRWLAPWSAADRVVAEGR